ncbi:hypothetical protein FRC02_008248 [Tulasnella sp. 418]|nr:hypothetical protein FRC02_008248 [Tulasnella sp. 418]
MTSSTTTNTALKQLKYIVSGGFITYLTNVHGEILTLLRQGGWPSYTTQFSVGLCSATVTIFLYLMVYLPRVKGIHPDYQNWRTSPDLSVLVPALTSTIVFGWSSLAVSLSLWSNLDIVRSLIGSIGCYLLMFGLVGLIPVPPLPARL